MARSNSQLVNVLRQEDKITEKGMVTNSTSLNACLDMFFMAGATRHWDNNKRVKLFQKALVENPLLALKILFWVRDIRGGSGERDFFRDIILFLNERYPEYLKKNVHLIPEYGRWDDLFNIDTEISIPIIKKGLEEKNGLLAKWLPRKKQYNNFSSKVREYLGLSPKEYRKLIVELSNTVEQKMCDKKYENIDYQKVPSMAINKYRKAFYRNDNKRFKEYVENVKNGKSKMNAGAIYPHLLYRALSKTGRADIRTLKIVEDASIEAQWNSLPNYMIGSKHRILPMVDVSPSMTWGDSLPIEVAVSLGIYISERNESIFKDAFMTFSENPTIEFLKGSFAEKVYQLRLSKWGRTTNIEKSFELLLQKSIDFKIEEKYMPSIILIISDMQFDCAKNIDQTAIKMIQEKYEKHGYKIPQIVFWNVRGEMDNIPSDENQKGVGLISGFNISILKDILKGDIHKKPTPLETMLSVIESGRYDSVVI